MTRRRDRLGEDARSGVALVGDRERPHPRILPRGYAAPMAIEYALPGRSRWSPAPPRASAARPPAYSTPAVLGGAGRHRLARRPSGPPTGSATGRWRSPPTSPTPRRWSAAVDEVVERFGGLDVVVANAGVAPPMRPMSVVDPEAFERTLEIDLLGVWRTVHPALAAGDRAPRARGRRRLGLRLRQRGDGDPLRGRQGRGRAARPGAAGRALDPRGRAPSVAYFGFIDTRDGPGLVRGPGRPDGSRTCSRRRCCGACRRRRRGPRSSRGSSAARRGSSARAGGGPGRSLRGIVNPLLDARFDRDERMREAVREGERLGRAERTETTRSR